MSRFEYAMLPCQSHAMSAWDITVALPFILLVINVQAKPVRRDNVRRLKSLVAKVAQS